MKQLLSFLVVFTATITSHAKFTVTVPSNAPFDKIIVYSCPLSDLVTDGKTLSFDTIPSDSERIFQADVPMVYIVSPEYQDYNRMTIYAAPDEKISLTIDKKDLSEIAVSGSALMDSIARYRQALQKYSADSISLIPDREDRIMANYRFNHNYVLTHRNDPVALIPLMHMPAAMSATAIDSIGPDARKSLLAPIYERIRKNVAEYKLKREAQEASLPGNSARNFTLQSIDGSKVSLTDYRGKWVLLDFWGTWCGWCIKGFPAMREFHNDYSDRCTIVAIDCNDPEESWREFVESRQLPWVNLINDPSSKTNDAARQYGIESFPTKILIDPDGIIRLSVVGEDPSFYPQAIALITAE